MLLRSRRSSDPNRLLMRVASGLRPVDRQVSLGRSNAGTGGLAQHSVPALRVAQRAAIQRYPTVEPERRLVLFREIAGLNHVVLDLRERLAAAESHFYLVLQIGDRRQSSHPFRPRLKPGR